MSPEERGSLADLARLREEIGSDRVAMGRCLADIRDSLTRQPSSAVSRADLALVAVALHGWYTALESVLERTARILDNAVPSGETWHRDLLSQAMAEVPGVRPAILERRMYPVLVGLLEFRHFFRHAYGIDLDAGRLRGNVERAAEVAPEIDAMLDAFEAFLERTMSEVPG